ncbi:Nitrous oxide reductase, N-terminal [Glarea lozoyensis ATCC 20868]|uniref:Nitrous oxide reductase, N-terminal n=1 Tax=Glarea lozoyensis (strain ATCC 20868 / MF5171) TaxID=1116229 RepID=S3D5V2_GLAL2|nr:Nitrous oxide reductase, N-terminal [Glarea lozoyensis ATCC 20868]EPE32514.1 Nitrous oxide reductase, N-terminal [Glarea lozoyensis ATCC 20868]
MRFHALRNITATTCVVATVAECTVLHVASYSGNVTTFDLKRNDKGIYSLATLGVTNGSAPQASWLELDAKKKTVYGLDEAWSTPNGTITVYSNKKNVLEISKKYTTLAGAVSTIVYNGGKALAVAHYGAQALTTWSIAANDGALSNIGNFIFSTPPGPVPQQDKSHPHEALVDPTDSYILVPDLGSDLLRTFAINAADSKLRELTPFKVPAGSGPRHGSFYTPACKPGPGKCLAANKENTYFFLVSELANTVSSYKVTYGKDGLGFTLVSSSGIYGNVSTPTGAAAAEGILSPDNKFFHTTGRNAPFLTTPNPDSANTTALASDAIQTWAIDAATGKLTFQGSYPAGGVTPRQFSINAKGDMAAVGLQTTGRLVILKRDIASGAFGAVLASVEGLGGVTTSIWDEGNPRYAPLA